MRDWTAPTPLHAFVSARDRLLCGPALAFARDTLDELGNHPADVVVVDMALFGVLLAAERAGVPAAVAMPTVYVRPTPGATPVGIGLTPARGPLGRQRDHILTAAASRAWDTGTPALNEARTALGLPRVSHPFSLYDGAARVLVLTTSVLDRPQVALPRNVVYAGPVLDDPSWAGDEVVTPPGTDPLVLVGLSATFQDQASMLQRIITALGSLPVRGLVTLGPSLESTRFDAPPNVRGDRPGAAQQGPPQRRGHGDARRARLGGAILGSWGAARLLADGA